jgi:chromosome segregation ATPase
MSQLHTQGRSGDIMKKTYIGSLKEENKSLRGKNKSLKEENKSLKGENKSLKEQYADQQRRIQELKLENTNLRKVCDELDEKNDELHEKYDEADQRYWKLKRDRGMLEKSMDEILREEERDRRNESQCTTFHIELWTGASPAPRFSPSAPAPHRHSQDSPAEPASKRALRFD